VTVFFGRGGSGGVFGVGGVCGWNLRGGEVSGWDGDFVGSNAARTSSKAVSRDLHASGTSTGRLRVQVVHPRSSGLVEGRGAIGVAGTYSPTSPALKHASTDSQSELESLPINRTSRWGRVTGNSLKYDAACRPACFQSRSAQSVGANGFGACVVIRPTTTSGLCQW